MGDGNNSFFHASIKTQNNVTSMKNLYRDDDTSVSTREEIEEVILQYYQDMMGKRDNNLQHIDIEATRVGTQLSMEQRDFLLRPFSE